MLSSREKIPFFQKKICLRNLEALIKYFSSLSAVNLNLIALNMNKLFAK